MAKDGPEIDYVYYPSIHFPSDRLRIADLRRLYPAEFDDKGPPPLAPDTFVEKTCSDHGQPLPPPQRDWLLDQLRALPPERTIADLRRQHPDVFDMDLGFDFDEFYQLTADLSNMLWTERVLARNAYNQAEGLGAPLTDQEGYRHDLAQHYRQFGLIRGEHEARELIARFEAAAAAQARPGSHPQRGG